MKNFQQTPRQQRVRMAANKARLQSSRRRTQYLPYNVWLIDGSKHAKIGGVQRGLLIEKQEAAAYRGWCSLSYSINANYW